ncbi:MAG: 3-dehydroquinate synthase [Phycisphaerae bacterium]|nr:3-dehydroquinate synthase [Phycisphaerae bacterium]
MTELTVKVPGIGQTEYQIHIGCALLGTLLDRVHTQFPGHKPFVVTDQNLKDAGHLETLIHGQVNGKDIPVYVIDPPGEVSKHIQTAVAIVEAMEKAYLGRDSVVIALGGGTVGDIAGFAASLFKRGVPVVQVPTTALAQADSSVGGKTGVDSSVSKNAFGVFWHPAAVYMDVDSLATLNDRDFRAGLVESVKHAMIQDAAYFEYLEQNITAILARDTQVLSELALKNCRIKGHVVQIDPLEKNMRRILNYGHTIGHAVESASRFGLLHGEAIAIGLIGAARIEMAMGLGDQARLNRTSALLETLGVPLKIPREITRDTVLDLIKRDKKAVDKWPKFVLISRFGQVHQVNGQWAVDVKQEMVNKVLDSLY